LVNLLKKNTFNTLTSNRFVSSLYAVEAFKKRNGVKCPWAFIYKYE